ncbi:MAG: class I SAM-dependent methyltransferase [Oscillospiraceae bacterium]|nr:class I SAM-dependent methyltransferase [Oscillospiraceae bacterium]
MSDKVLSFYDEYTRRGGEDQRATSSRSNSLEFHYTKKALSEFITRGSRVLEVGCGTGHYGIYFADKCKEYVGIDIYQPHLDIFNSKIKENRLTNVSCQKGDAMNLSGIDNDSFDVILCLGPMYHLPKEDREAAFAECARICKPNGIAAFAYVNKIGAYVGGCVHDEMRSDYPNKETNSYVLKQGTSDLNPGVFYFSMPEEMTESASRHGLTKIRNMGTDFFVTMSVVDKMDDEKFEIYMELADEMVKYESCAGMSNHALLICRKSNISPSPK